MSEKEIQSSGSTAGAVANEIAGKAIGDTVSGSDSNKK